MVGEWHRGEGGSRKVGGRSSNLYTPLKNPRPVSREESQWAVSPSEDASLSSDSSSSQSFWIPSMLRITCCSSSRASLSWIEVLLVSSDSPCSTLESSCSILHEASWQF